MSEERAMPVGLESSSMPARTCADLSTFSARSLASVYVRGGPLTRMPLPLKISGWLMWSDQFLRAAGSLMKSVPTSCARLASDRRLSGGQRYSSTSKALLKARNESKVSGRPRRPASLNASRLPVTSVTSSADACASIWSRSGASFRPS